MKIVLSGVETNNKGAELMLYAILQQVEKVAPDSEVFIPRNMVRQGLQYVKTNVKLKYLPVNIVSKVCTKLKITGLLNRLGFYNSMLNNSCPIKDVDYFIDGSGLLFSDKRISNRQTAVSWQSKLKEYHRHGARIVFLPQGFGPFKKKVTKETIAALDKYADLIFAREQVSLSELKSITDNSDKIRLYPDFTSLVDGECPEIYKRLSGKVCIIPNFQMVAKGVISRENYLCLIHSLIEASRNKGFGIYLLNHEGNKDELLAKEYKDRYNDDIELVTGLNAIEVKGLISTAYLVISSRFHGVASSLNTHVPCLATSWHHKYEELFKDYGMNDCVLPIDDIEASRQKVLSFLDADTNQSIRKCLSQHKPAIMEKNKEMWRLIWNLKK